MESSGWASLRRLKGTGSWALVGQAGTAVFSLATIPFLVRYLGTAQFGVYSLINASIACLTFTDLGMGVASTRFAAIEHARNNARGEADVIWCAMLLSGAPTTMVVITVAMNGAWILARLMPAMPASLRHSTATALGIAAAIFAIRTLTNVVNTPQLVRGRLDINSLINVTIGAITMGVTIVILLDRGRLPVVFLGMCCVVLTGFVAHFVASASLLPALARPRLSMERIRALAGFGMPMFVTYVTSIAFGQIEKIVLARVVSPTALAYYSVAFTVGSVFSLAAAAYSLILVPAFASVGTADDGESVAGLFRWVLRLTVIVAAPAMTIMIALGRPFLSLWAGSAFGAASYWPLCIVTVASAINLAANVPFYFLIAGGFTKRIAAFHLIELPIYLVSVVYGVRWWGAVGAAAAWAVRIVIDALLVFGSCLQQVGTDHRRKRLLLWSLLLLPPILLAVTGYGLVAIAAALTIAVPGFLWRAYHVELDGQRTAVARAPGP